MFSRYFLPLLLAAALPAWAQTPALNTLTDEEKAAGWQLLFDGTSTKGWHAAGQAAGSTGGWVAEDGELKLKAGSNGKTAGKDLLTEQEFSEFELTWEWKISAAGNSGLKYNLPDKTKDVGCEYQMLDDERHPDGKVKGGTHTTASLYDVIAPTADKKMSPVGEWNQSRILVKGNHVEHWLNGGKTVEFDFGSEELKKLIATSKFKTVKGWGELTRSPILLQDHGNEASVRNLKIRGPAH